MPAWVRRCLTVACLLTAWLVARPAAAAAPMCDERGASMLAPTPILDVSDASVDVGEHPDACDEDASRDKAYHRGERSHKDPPQVRADAMPAPPAVQVPPSARRPSPQPDLPSVDRSGVRFLLERPPR